MQQQIQKLMLQQNSNNQAILQGNIDNLLHFPYNYYPYWTYSIYPNQGYQFNNYCMPYCKHCKLTTYQTVKTQTYDNLMEVDQQSNSKNIQIIDNNFEYSRNLRLYSYSIQQNKLNYQANFGIAGNSKNVSEISENIINCQEQKFPSSLPQDPSLKYQKPSQFNNIQNTQNNNCQTNQQLFYKMLQFYKTHPKKYTQLTQNYLKSQSLISQLVKCFNTKLDNFKKSKEQMIKFIIRKTQRQYKIKNNCKRDQRFTKFGGFKSMNSVYLIKLFSDPNFVNCYNMITVTFIEDFQKQNLQKLTDFIDKICAANNYLQYKSAMRFLDEKNKMPWPVYWIQKLKKTCEELKFTYILDKNITDQNQKNKQQKQ